MNGIENELDGVAEVIRVDLWSQLGKQVAKRFDVTSAGTTVVLNGSGQEVYRHQGFPNRKKIIELVTG